MNTRLFAIFIFIVFVLSTCNNINPFKSKTVRDIYANKFNKKSIAFVQWDSAYYKAKSQSLLLETSINLSFQKEVDSLSAVAYFFPVKRGERLVIDVQKDVDTSFVFIEMRQKQSENLVKELTQELNTLAWEAREDDTLQVVFQAGYKHHINYQARIYKQPSYFFPVIGKDNRAIASFWGAQRDAGRRTHEGIDIFASRGTPVVAVTDGRIRRTGNRGLGGKQVWLYDNKHKLSSYYAHLDSIIAISGTSVKRGDTLGMVGNTGNASTTSPHLHYGLYGFGGAIDPLLFVKEQAIPDFKVYEFRAYITVKRETSLKKSANTHAVEIKRIAKDTHLNVLSRTADWLHVVDKTGMMGFIKTNAIK